MDTFAFVTTGAVPFKTTNVNALCGSSLSTARRNPVALRRSTFTRSNVFHAQRPRQDAKKATTKRDSTSMIFWSKNGSVTQDDVIAAQEKWAAGVVKIGSLKDNKEECAKYTEEFLNERYAFGVDNGMVLFKPTKCADRQFRPTKPEALSYFIAGDKKKYNEDGGFAVTPWTNIRWENTGFILEQDRAIAMGNYFFTDTSGGETKVEYTFGYKKVDGDLKIDLHHSSIPFPTTTITEDEVIAVQEKWAKGVVTIGTLKDNKAALEAYTDEFLDERYAFSTGNGMVLFKPTKCADRQFRPTKPEAMSYFIAGDKKKFDEDGGFAVTPWTDIHFENTGMILESDRAIAMGNYYFTDVTGGQTKVEYTFGYKKVDGDLKIDLHHSSIPFPNPVVTQAEVLAAQEKWAAGVVKIGSLKDNKQELVKYTDQFLDERYAFDIDGGWVLFKPTKCADQQFRSSKAQATSYFIAGEKKAFDEDGGFAVTPWTNIRWENTGFILEQDRAMAMGNYYFTDTSGGETKVEYTFGYKKSDGELKIDLHHSSLPFPKS